MQQNETKLVERAHEILSCVYFNDPIIVCIVRNNNDYLQLRQDIYSLLPQYDLKVAVAVDCSIKINSSDIYIVTSVPDIPEYTLVDCRD